MEALSQLFLTKIKELLQSSGPTSAAAEIQEYLQTQDNIPLNIAITGESGAGKSTFVNAFRGVDHKDKNAAPTGCVETTTKVTPYPHPHNPKVTLWDLPGIGTTRFPADQYLQRVGFEKFDFFIIISDTRFRENDVKLAQEIQKMGKQFYFVRSKIDQDLSNTKRTQREFNAENTQTQIRGNCIQGLQGQGIDSPQVFLVSSFELHLYDFHLLQETLERELPAHKRNVLLCVLPNVSRDIIQKKKEILQSQIMCYASLSALVAAVPVPGLSIAVDLGILVVNIIKYQVTFGLDMESLKNLAQTTGVPLADLRAVMTSPLSAVEIKENLIMKLLSVQAGVVDSLVLVTKEIVTELQLPSIIVALTAAEEGARFIPLLGIPAAMGLSFTSTYRLLSWCLNMLSDDAQKVFEKALG